jgi:Uma2 family endonuclease
LLTPMNIPLLDKPAFQPIEEKLVTLHGMTWEQFKAIEAQLEHNRSVRLSYLAGVMEIMSPISAEHEYVKSTLSLLLETYFRHKGIRFYKRWGIYPRSPWICFGNS